MGQAEVMLSAKEVHRPRNQPRAGGQIGVGCAAVGPVGTPGQAAVPSRQDWKAAALASKRRGPSNRRIDTQRKNAIMAWCKNTTRLWPTAGQRVPAATAPATHQRRGAARLMIEAGLWKAKKRRQLRQHSPRERRARRGELVQIDGSHHDWFEGRAERCPIAFIDDASGQCWPHASSRARPRRRTWHCCVNTSAPTAHRWPTTATATASSPNTTAKTRPHAVRARPAAVAHRAPSAHTARRPRGAWSGCSRPCRIGCAALRVAGISELQQANAWLPTYIAQHNERFAVQPRDG